MESISLLAEIKQKAAELPRYVEVPDALVAPWNLDATTPIELRIEGGKPVRRTLKKWGKGRPVWFFELTKPMCKKGNIETGDMVEFSLTLADDSTAAEIEAILKTNLEAQIKWDTMTPSMRRMINENVLEGKRADTRQRRARKFLGGEPE